MHPAAVIKGAELRGTRARLDEATAAAPAAGVRDVPAVRVGDARVPRRPRAGGTPRGRSAALGVKANREYELIVRRGGRGPAALADPDRVDQVEIVEIATGEVALFWDTAPAQTRPPVARAQGRPRAARAPTSSCAAGAAGNRAKGPAARCRLREWRELIPSPRRQAAAHLLSSS